MKRGWLYGPLFDEAGDGSSAGGGVAAGADADIGGGDSGGSDADFDTAFSKSWNSAEPVQAEDPEPDPEPEGLVENAPAAEPAAKEAEAQQPAFDDDDPLDFQPEKVDGKRFFFNEPKAKRLMAAADTLNRIAEAIPDPSPETLKGYYESAVIQQEMVSDFDSGDPDRIGKFVDYWFSSEAPPAAVDAFAGKFMERLPHIAPQAFQQFRQQSNQQLAQDLYDRAIRTGNESLFTLAQHLDFNLRGKFFEKGDFQQRDPYAEDKARFEQERQRFYQDRQREAQRQTQQRAQSIDQSIGNVRTQAIEEALKPIADQFRGKPQWNHMQRDLGEAVDKAIQSNAVWQRQFQMARQRAVEDPSGKAGEQMTAMLKQFIQPVIDRNRKAVISAATGAIISASAKAHENGAQTAARREPTSPAGTAQRLTHEQKLREAGAKGGFDAAFGLSAQRAREVTRQRTART